MFVYGTYPVVSTEVLFEVLKRYSDDPLVQVIAIALDNDTNTVVAFGVNKLVNFFGKNNFAIEEMTKDKNPMKKFLVRHAEFDLIDKLSEHKNSSQYEYIISVQPCMSCLSRLLDKKMLNIKYLTENRHQDEQELIKPFMKNINYGKISHKMVCVPPWIAKEAELEEAARNIRTLQKVE